MLQFDFAHQVNLINGSLADKALVTDGGYRLISHNLPPRKFTGPQPGCGSLSRELSSFV
jgi:hypothetical protein